MTTFNSFNAAPVGRVLGRAAQEHGAVAAPVGDLTITPRVDYIYTGKSTGNIFNGVVNEVPSFSQVNAQLQVDGADKKWFVRAWIQNITNNDAITGLYVTDQSSGNFTNIFTLEPRRYGLTAGVKF